MPVLGSDRLAGDLVAELLERSAVTKSALSERSGVSRSLIDDYLKGNRQPSIAQLDRLGRSVGFHMRAGWVESEDRTATPEQLDPAWLIRDNPAMQPRRPTIDQRAQVLRLVVPVAMAQRRRPRGALEFPPFRDLTAS